MSDGMFLSACRQVAKEFPDVQYDEDLLDRVCLQIVQNPRPYSDRVMVMPNLYGGILSNIAAALVGGPGVVPGCNMGRDVAVFEPGCRHVASDIMGTNKANPAAMILSATMMLRHLGSVLFFIG